MKRASSLLHVFTTLFILFLCTVLFSGVPASAVDVDRDGKDDITVYRPSTGVWYILLSSTGYDINKYQAYLWGNPGIPVPGDYDGDGKTHIADYRASEGVWYLLQSSDGYDMSKYKAYKWGGDPADIPVPGDYDGDGTTDSAVWRPGDGVWYLLQSSDGFDSDQIQGVLVGRLDRYPRSRRLRRGR